MKKSRNEKERKTGEGESSPRYKSPETPDNRAFRSFIQNCAKNCDMGKTRYTPIILKDKDGDMSKRWYFECYFEGERIRMSAGINRIKSLPGRYQFADRFISKVNAGMKSGILNLKDAVKTDDRGIIALLETEMKKKQKTVSTRTVDGHALVCNRLRKFIKSLGEQDITVSEFTEDMALAFGNYMEETMGLSAKSYNWQLQFLNQFSEILVSKKVIESNPFAILKRKKIVKSAKYIPFTDDEKQKISVYLEKENPLLHAFVQIVYTCFIRPKEICGLTRNEIDFKKKTITVPFSIAKNKHTSHRQMFDGLITILKKCSIEKLPGDAIVFESICGNNKSLHLRRKKINELWRTLIKERLKIDKDLYAMKHTGNIDYIRNHADYDIVWLQRQNDHHSLSQTQQYIRELGIYQLADSSAIQPFG